MEFAFLHQYHWSFLLLIVAASCALVRGQSGGTTSGSNGTTPDFRNIFVSRCQNFQKTNPQPFINNPKNCSQLLEIFLNSFANKSSCNVTQSDYSNFLVAANHTSVIENKALFWSFVNPFVYNFSDSQPGQYTTILNLLSGYILNDLTWCWNLTRNDLDYNSCPSYKQCPLESEASRSFWKANSENFANISAGTVFAMLNGSTTEGAYLNKSLFYTVEVPSMTSRIKSMQVILVQNLDGPFSENCTDGTLLNLQYAVNAKGITFSCTANPDAVKKLQCRLYQQYAKYCVSRATTSVQYFTYSTTLCRSVIVLFAIRRLHYILS